MTLSFPLRSTMQIALLSWAQTEVWHDCNSVVLCVFSVRVCGLLTRGAVTACPAAHTALFRGLDHYPSTPTHTPWPCSSRQVRDNNSKTLIIGKHTVRSQIKWPGPDKTCRYFFCYFCAEYLNSVQKMHVK